MQENDGSDSAPVGHVGISERPCSAIQFQFAVVRAKGGVGVGVGVVVGGCVGGCVGVVVGGGDGLGDGDAPICIGKAH